MDLVTILIAVVAFAAFIAILASGPVQRRLRATRESDIKGGWDGF